MKPIWRNFCDLLPDEVPPEIDRQIVDPKIGPCDLVGAYQYHAVAGAVVALKPRYENEAGEKTYRCWYPSADGWHDRKPEGFSMPLYGLQTRRKGETLVGVEGPKAAAALHRVGIPAVAIDSTSSADTVDLQALDGYEVIPWGDHDEPGTAAMDKIASRLDREHRRVNPEVLDLPAKGDAADLVADLISGWSPNGWTGTTPFPQDAGFHPAEIAMERIAPALVTIRPRIAWDTLPANWLTVEIPHRDFVFRNAVPVEAVTLLVGIGGGGKGQADCTLAMSAASGRELLRGFEPAFPGPVALVSLEDDLPEITRRMQRIARYYNLGPDEARRVAQNLHILCLPTFQALTASSAGLLVEGPDLASLRRSLATMRPRLVILDPLAALLGGAVDENCNASAQAVVGLIRGAMPPDAGVLIACHVSKAERELSNTARGASAWMDASRQVFALRPLDQVEARNVPADDDSRQYLALELRKSNYTAPRPPLYLRRSLEPETAGVLSAVDFEALRGRADQALRDAIVEALAEQPDGITKREIMGNGKTPDAELRGRAFRETVSRILKSDVTCSRLRSVIDNMLADRLLTQVSSHKRLLLKSGVSSSDDVDPENK